MKHADRAKEIAKMGKQNEDVRDQGVYFFVAIENGEPVFVCRDYKVIMILDWQQAQPGRAFVKVQEWT